MENFDDEFKNFGHKQILKLIEKGEINSALELSLKFHEIHESGLSALLVHDCYLLKGDNENCSKWTNIAYIIEPGFPGVKQTYMEDLFGNGNFEEMLKVINNEIDKNPFMYYERARVNFQFGYLDLCKEDLVIAESLIDDFEEIWKLYVHYYCEIFDIENANQYLNKIIAFDGFHNKIIPEHKYIEAKVKFFNELKTLSYKNKNINEIESFKICRKVIDSNIKDFRIMQLLSLICWRSGLLNDALNYINESILLNKKNHEAFEIKGNLNFCLKNFESAIECYNDAITLNGKRQNTFFNIGFCYYYLGDFSKSKEFFQKSIEMSFSKSFQRNLNLLSKFKNLDENNYTLNSILKQELWFSHPSKFNDPIDGDYLLNLFEKYKPLKESLNSIYMCCFKKHPSNNFSVELLENDHLMWSHYANNHTGIELVFEVLENSNNLNQIEDFISYETNYEHFSLFDNFNLSMNLLNTLRTSFFTKFIEWQYENEFRILKNDSNISKGKTYGFNELNLKLKALVFGLKAPMEKIQEIIKKVKETYTYEVDFYKIQKDSESKNHFKLIKEKI